MHNSNNSALSKDTIFGAKNHTDINSIFNSASVLEKISVAKVKEALTKKLLALKNATQLSGKHSNTSLPNNITETPIFHEAKAESTQPSASACDRFARIGVRAREAFIEEQIERANLYNIPYKTYGDNYYGLMFDIDRYEYLLERAKDYCVDWDISEYDPIALEQELEEAEHNSYLQDQALRSSFSLTRGVEV